MKKIKYLLLLGLVTIIATGCVKYNVNIDIKKDKSMDFSIIYAFDKSLTGKDNGVKEEDIAAVKQQGFEATKYSEGNYEGFKLVKKFANIDEVSSEADVTFDLSGMNDEEVENKYIFKVVKGKDKNTYTAKFKFDANEAQATEEEEEETPDEVETDYEISLDEDDLYEEAMPDDEALIDGTLDITSDLDLSALTSGMDLSFTVNLPYSAISSNATTKENDNKKLTWKLNGTGEEYIEFAFELNNSEGFNMLYLIIGAAVLVILIIIGILLTKKNKKPTEPVPVEEPTPVEPVNQMEETVTPVAPMEPAEPVIPVVPTETTPEIETKQE